MKKINSILFIFLMVLVLTGCSSEKSLVCINDESELGEAKVDMLFKSDELVSYEMSMKMNMAVKLNEDEASMFCDEYENVEGIKCSVSVDERVVTSIIEVDLDKVTDKQIENIGFSTDTYDNILDSATEEGFTCESK